MRGLISAITLLTTIPMPKLGHSSKNIAWAYPLVGLLLGIIYGLLIFALSLLPLKLSMEIFAIAIIIIKLFITGALHFDAIADIADGFWGGYNKLKRLTIMSDSRIGAYGTIAIVCVILLYYTLFVALNEPITIIYSLIVSSVVSRAIMAIIQLTNPPAKTSGLLNSVADKNKFAISLIQTIFIILFSGVVIVWLLDIDFILTIFVVAFVVWLLLSLLFRRKIGGITGDCLGASQIISEIIILITIIEVLNV